MRILLIIIALSIISPCISQEREEVAKQEMSLTLDEMISLAKFQSIASFRSQNMYLARYWEFKSYKASKLPGLRINTTPIDYNRSKTREYNYIDSTYSFVNNEILLSDIGLSLTQNLTPTGGQISLNSDFRRLENLGSDKISYTTTPISIRLSQPLNGYNQFKWESKLKPLAFDKAKKTFLSEMEALSEQATRIFFNTVSAEIDLKIAETNLANADTLFNIGKGRFQIGTVTQDELLDLELSFLNAKMAKTKSEITLKQAQNYLNSFLGFEKNIVITPIIPDKVPGLKINANKALELAKENNPDILEMEEMMITANQNLAYAKSSSGLNADIRARLGINKQSKEFNELYLPPFDDDRGLSISINAPIIDWGQRRGQIQMAKSDKQVTEATIKQELIDFEQKIIMRVLEFNLQEEQVKISAKADTIAQLGYDVTKQRFMIDKVDVIKLNAARNSLDGARRNYINALLQYWSSYYNIRQLTLFDFEDNQSLIISLEHLLE